MAFGEGMGLFPVYVGKQIHVNRDVMDDSIQSMPGGETDLVMLPTERRMNVRPSMQGENGDEDDLVVTPEAVEAAQGMMMQSDPVATRRGRSIVKRQRVAEAPAGSVIDKAVKKAVGRIRHSRMFIAEGEDEGINLTPESFSYANEGEADVVLSDMCDGLGRLFRKKKKKKKRAAPAPAVDASAVAAAQAAAAQAAAAYPQQFYPGTTIPVQPQYQQPQYQQPQYQQPQYQQPVQYPVQPQYPDVSAAPAYPQAMFQSEQTYPDNMGEDAMIAASAVAPTNDSEVVPMDQMDQAVMPGFEGLGEDADSLRRFQRIDTGARAFGMPQMVARAVRKAVSKVKARHKRKMLLIDSGDEAETQIPYGNVGGEDFDVDVAPSLPGGEAAEPRRVFPSGALSVAQLNKESGEESMITDDIEVPVGMGDADKFMDDPMRDGFMQTRVTPGPKKYDTIGDAGMPKRVKPEEEDIYEQVSAEEIDDMARPASLSQGNFAGEPYRAGESMIPFGRSLKGKRMDILDTSVVGLSPGRMAGQRGNSPAGYDPNYLVDGETISLELSGEGGGEDFVNLGQLPSIGALGWAGIENTMMTLRLRESALMSISPAGYEAAITPYAPLREKINADYEAMKADNTKVVTMGLTWGMSAATYKSVLDRAINAANSAIKAARPKPQVITQIKEVVREMPKAVKETIFSKYGLVIAIGGAAVIGGLLFLRSKQKKS
jgi:hypothetical protein